MVGRKYFNYRGETRYKHSTTAASRGAPNTLHHVNPD
jgi:hypothetical protein